MVDPKNKDDLVAERADIRKAIVKAHGKLVCHTYKRDTTITTEQCDEWADSLVEIDAELGKDSQSTNYYEKIKEIVDQLELDAKLPPPPFKVPTSLPSAVQTTVRDKEAKIPPFDGQPSTYRPFERMFEAKYESNPSYSDADRFLIFRNLIGDK